MFVPRPNAPPPGEWNFTADHQEVDGPWRRLRGKVTIEGAEMLFRADEVDYNEETGAAEARGNVFFQHFTRKEQVWADRLEYNIEEQRGKFYNVRGTGEVRIDARPGVLTSNNPFYFEGEWAEREGDAYTLYNGYITNCKMPRPWWRLKGPRFVIVPGDHATAYRSMFLLRKFPLFYAPFFYKSLQTMPRRSGFLIPNLGNSSRRGKMIGIGYYWAINRSYDATYRVQDFTQRGFAHTVDFRGKPREGTDFDAVLYGVQDRGLELDDGSRRKEGGLSLYCWASPTWGTASPPGARPITSARCVSAKPSRSLSTKRSLRKCTPSPSSTATGRHSFSMRCSRAWRSFSGPNSRSWIP